MQAFRLYLKHGRTTLLDHAGMGGASMFTVPKPNGNNSTGRSSAVAPHPTTRISSGRPRWHSIQRSRAVAERMSKESYSEEETPTTTSPSQQLAGDSAPRISGRLFDYSHLPSTVQETLALLLWLPVGIPLAVFRMVLWTAGVLLDAPWFRNSWVVSTYLALLGFKVSWKNEHLIPKHHHVMVSNHTTSGDLMFLFNRPRRYHHLITSAMPGRVTLTRNLPVVLKYANPDVYAQLAAASENNPDAPPVHVFPEGGLTNGSGMLQFSRGFMKFVHPDTPVVPVALRARNPLGVRTHTLTSSFLANLFWFSLCPWLEIEAVVLPPMLQTQEEGRGAFVQRVQQAIADELGVPISDLTISQKRKLMAAVGGGSSSRGGRRQ